MNIAVILGSTRTNRLGDRVAKYVMREATKNEGITFSFLDLATYDLPFFNEPLPPLANQDRHPEENVQRWLNDVAAADGYMILTPEYNYAAPAALKNALDYIAHEAEKKPVSILSYADTPHGANIAGNELRLTVNKIGMLPLPKSFAFANAQKLLNEAGEMVEQSEAATKVATILPAAFKDLIWYTDALKVARDKQ